MNKFLQILFLTVFWITVVFASVLYLGIIITSSSPVSIITNPNPEGISSILPILMNYVILLAAIFLMLNAGKFIEEGYNKTLSFLILCIFVISNLAIYSLGDLLLLIISLIIGLLPTALAVIFLLKNKYVIAKWFMLLWFVYLALFPFFTFFMLLIASFD